MSDLQKAYLASAVRWLITAACGWAVKHGVDNSAAIGFAATLNPESIVAELLALVPIIWSLIHKKNTNTALVVAAATGTTTATPSAKDTVLIAKAVTADLQPPVSANLAQTQPATSPQMQSDLANRNMPIQDSATVQPAASPANGK